jgi:polysaccharide export outer membrane protein
LRTEAGQQRTFPFNYDTVIRGKNIEQNIVLLPGDTIVIPE